MRWTVVFTTVCPVQPFWFFRDPFPKGLLLFLSVLLRTHATDRHPYDGSSCTTFLVAKEPIPKGLSIFSKCTQMENYEGPSYPRRSVLHDRYDGKRPLS